MVLAKTRHTTVAHWLFCVFFCSYFIPLDSEYCNQGRFYSRQWESLPKLICESGGFSNWLHHFLFSAVVPNTKTGINLVQSFNDNSRSQGCHSILDSYLTLKLVAQTLIKWSKLILISWKLRGIDRFFYPQDSEVWLWPMLRWDWLSSIKGRTSINNCLWIELFDAALEDIPYQDNGLYLCENQGWERAFLHAWRKHGHGKIIGVPHSTVPFWHLNCFDDPRTINSRDNLSQPLPDQMAVNGPVAWDAFLESDYRPEQLVEVEALR